MSTAPLYCKGMIYTWRESRLKIAMAITLIAKKMLEKRTFHPWEGGEGKVVRQYLICHLELAKKAIIEKQFDTALCLLEAAEKYPENLGKGNARNAGE